MPACCGNMMLFGSSSLASTPRPVESNRNNCGLKFVPPMMTGYGCRQQSWLSVGATVLQQNCIGTGMLMMNMSSKSPGDSGPLGQAASVPRIDLRLTPGAVVASAVPGSDPASQGSMKSGPAKAAGAPATTASAAAQEPIKAWRITYILLS